MTGKQPVLENPKRFDPNDHRTVIPWKTRMGAPTKYDETSAGKIFAVLANGKSKEQACSALGIGVTTLHEWEKIHPDIQKAIKQGREAGMEYWDLMALESCFEGSDVKLGLGYIMKMRNQYGMMTRDPDKTNENQAVFMQALKAVRSGGKVTKDEWEERFGKKSGE